MATTQQPIDRFRGSLLGLAVGDALGALFEGQDREWVCSRCPDVSSLLAYPKEDIWYTDDTQMMIGVVETLAEHGEIVEQHLCAAFAANYVPSRGYGRGARAVLDVMEAGGDYWSVAESYFPGGSYGNGAAMRVAPVGLFFADDREKLWEQARLSALPTHAHPHGIEGACLLALAVALALEPGPFDREAFFRTLTEAATSEEYRGKFRRAARVRTADELGELGNGIEALESVPTAIASFALTPDSFGETIGNVILLGGDTDTMAAMAGAISGARVGIGGVSPLLVGLLEDSPKGRRYIDELAARLFGRQ